MKLRPALVAEFIGTFTLIFVGVFAIHNANGDLLLVALAYGLAIAVMVSAFGHVSGGHLNPAVTVGAMADGKIAPVDGLLYIVAQLLVGTVAALSTASIVSYEMVAAGTPVLAEPITGAAMNTARAFGPAVASGTWDNHIVYWIGPLLGGTAAGPIYSVRVESQRVHSPPLAALQYSAIHRAPQPEGLDRRDAPPQLVCGRRSRGLAPGWRSKGDDIHYPAALGETYCRRDRWSRWRSTIAPTVRNTPRLAAGIVIPS